MSIVYDCQQPTSRADGLAAAVATLRAGRLAVFPTDNVYGVGCDAFSDTGIETLRGAKGLSTAVTPAILVGSWATVDGLTLHVPVAARALIEAFWPGSLSLVFRQAPSLAWSLKGGSDTMIVRMPLHPLAIELCAEIGPIALSMANKSGSARKNVTTVEQAREELDPAPSVYLDAGEMSGTGVSTIVDVTGNEPKLVREGLITASQISEVIGEPVAT
jgi:tRNA threonylcarbamoyl adenosine modification protein (Sua5/YciO/YrdC/YwlC family)